jgi:hypothetical protein
MKIVIAKNNNKNKKAGFALLYIMLVLASIVVALSLAANQSGFFSANRLKSYTTSADVRMIGMYCGESLLMQIRNTPGLTGSGTLSYNGGSCDYDITGAIPDKTITINASKNNIYKKLTITTSQVYPTITATWLETN